MNKKINYTYRYCTQKMIEDAMFENEISYPDVMEYVEYEIFEVKAKSLEIANKAFLNFHISLGKIFEVEKDVDMDIKVEDNEDRYIKHGLEQDWDTYYFKRDKNGLA